MRKIAASYIMPVSSPILKNGIVVVDDDGSILEVIDTGGRLRESSSLEFYSGVITPGFVLPWLRAAKQTGALTGAEFRDLDRGLVRQGLKAVGLLENKAGHFAEKVASPVTYHTILELCPKPGEEEFEVYQQAIDLISESWNEYNQPCSMTCCTTALMETDLAAYILEFAARHQVVIPLAGSDSWSLPEQLIRLKQHMDRIAEEPPAGIYANAHLILVHDNPGDLSDKEAPDRADQWNTFHALRTENHPNMLEILLAWQESSPGHDLGLVLPEFTMHAARALFEDERLGSIEPGKKPGLNLLSNTEPGTLRLSPKTTLKVLV